MPNNAVIKSRIVSPQSTTQSGSGSLSIPISQISKTTETEATSAFSVINFDSSDFETDSTVIEYNGTDGFQIKENGVYEISYDMDLDTPDANYIVEFTGRVTDNGSTVSKSSALATTFYDNAVAGGQFRSHLGKHFLCLLSNGSTIRFEIKATAAAGSTSASVKPNALMIIKKIPG